jgi:SNF2 family DNA or RNA helicase
VKAADLRPYQREGVEFLLRKRYAALWVGMRLGKTIVTLTALQKLYDACEVHRVLVVAPTKVSINSWPEDLRQWEHISLPHQLIRGTPTQRYKQMQNAVPVHIINRELLSWLVTQWGDAWPYDCVVLDEARSFKNHARYTKTKELTRFGAMSKVRPRVHRVIELTGTPAPNGYADLWAQIYLLDGGKRLGKNITEFRRTYMVEGRKHFLWSLREGADTEIREKIKDVVFCPAVTRDVVSDVVFNDIEIPLPTDVRGWCSSMLRTGTLLTASGETVTAANRGVRLSKALQIVSGGVYLASGQPETIHDEKFRALDELLEVLGTNVIIVYNFVFEKDRILRRYPDAVLLDEKPETVARWNRREIPKLVLHGASGGHGLSLWKGGNDLIWMGATYDLELYDQVNARLCHPEKPDPVTIHRLLAGGVPVETPVVQELIRKGVSQEALLDYVIEQSRVP